MDKIRTAYRDKNGNRIHLGDKVSLDGKLYEVILQPIAERDSQVVLCGEDGQIGLYKVYKICEVTK